MDSMPFSQSCENNKDFILEVLREAFADRRQVLEIASGTGQHACHFAGAMHWLQWQPTELAQNLPVLEALAELAPAITFRIALRDSTDLIEDHLTNGARSIPKLIAFDPTTEQVLFTWGPRPHGGHALVMGEKEKPESERLAKDALAEALHRWYHENAGVEVQQEIGACLAGLARKSQVQGALR